MSHEPALDSGRTMRYGRLQQFGLRGIGLCHRIILKSLSRSPGLDDDVRFLDPPANTEVAAHLARCQFAAVPSVVERYQEAEGAPTAVNVALAAGGSDSHGRWWLGLPR